MSTVEKAISLLNFFTEDEPEWGLSELARQARFDKATTRRLLVAMANSGLIEQHAVTRRYQLGAGLLRLARVRESHFPLLQVAVPVLREIAAATDETVHLSEFGARGLVTLHVEESTKANRVSVATGQVLPLHATASGLAFLAFSPAPLVKSYLRKPPTAFTRHTLVQPARLTEAIRITAERGYSRGDQGFEDGVVSIAAPILGLDGYALGSIAIAMPLARNTKATTDRHIQAVRGASEKISTRLFGEPPSPRHARVA